MATSDVFNQERISKISKIIPQFTKVAKVGDTVMMGLEGDPVFPYDGSNRPTATIESLTPNGNDVTIGLKMSDGTVKSVSMYSVAPTDVWEFTDKSFAQVMARERQAQEKRIVDARAEKPIEVVQKSSSNGDMRQEIASLRAELEAERKLTRNFHNTYIASLHELASDVCKIDNLTGGKNASFCKTFNNEYEKMQSRGELGVYRGAFEEEDEEGEERQQDEEEETKRGGEELDFFSESDNSMSDSEMLDSDYF